MTEKEDDKLRALLRAALPPVGDAEPSRDLWPQMLGRLDQRAPRVSWPDLVLAALALIWLLIFPEVLPGLLYQL